MVLGITHIDEVSVLSMHVAHPLRMMELGLLKWSINQANSPITDHTCALHSTLINQYDSVVGRISDNKEVILETGLLLNTENTTWITQVLFTGCSLLLAFVGRFGWFGLLQLPRDFRLVVQLLVIEVKCYWEEKIEEVSVTLAWKN